ncbi:MAG: type I-C CRISPR-associated protein Cas8c/Csd1 [Nitrospiraceae bacterium]|nr:type I-C CRISPR-associated protein Cas8c/Csd1 [Nitrospiraceae bacterium]
MIKELSELGKTLRADKADNEWVHDALKDETISLVLTIMPNGSFVSLHSIEKKKTAAEALQRTSGKGARLLIDNCGYVLGVYDCESAAFKKKVKEKSEHKAHDIFIEDTDAKNKLFKARLQEVAELNEVSPVHSFYKNHEAVNHAMSEFAKLSKKDRGGNIAFRISGENKYVHENETVYQKLIETYESKQQTFMSTTKKKCAVCASDQFPVGDFTHFPIKGVPGDKEPAGGRKLISYNGDHNPFESYCMIGNENSMICTNCAKTYVEGLNMLLSGLPFKNKRNKDDILYKHRWPRTRSASYGVDTAMIFWTRKNANVEEIDFLEEPKPEEVAMLIDSVASGKQTYIEPDQFYSCTLSGSAARIVVRDWIETSLFDFRKSIAKWFQDIAISEYDFDLKAIRTHYARLYDLARSCQRKNNDGKNDKDDTSLARAAACLWNAALKDSLPPLWLLTKVIQRARLDGVTADRAALIRLILNRHNKGGNFMVTENIMEGRRPVAYVCGQIFAKLESIQYAALGDRNAGIRERYFTYSMTSPASAFGRLFNLNSKHFTKLKSDKPGLAVTLDKELQELCKDVDINSFPASFTLEQQGQFAIGYYHQRQLQFSGANKTK